MKKLIAKVPILTQGRQFSPGELLPADDEKLVKLWLEHDSALWRGDASATAEPPAPLPAQTKTSVPERPQIGRSAGQKKVGAQ